jgi:methylglutaconyl-CoA hydratase
MLITSVSNRIGYIVLDRPKKKNAFNGELIAKLHEAFTQFNESEDIRAIVLKANGDSFSAGADLGYLQQLQANSFEENKEDSLKLASLFQEIYNSPKLTFSLVHGYALAGGCGLATITDFCYASANSQFGYTEVKIGFIPALVMMYLRKKLPETSMNSLLLTGTIIAAQEALDLGIVTEVFDETSFEKVANDKIQKTITKTSGEAIALTKELLRQTENVNLEDAINMAAEYNAMARSTDDCKKGIAAFLNKEKIKW